MIMQNHLTFPFVIAAILDNKKRDYPMNVLIRDLFSLSLPESAADSDEKVADNTMFSKWCSGARAIPLYILDAYDSDAGRAQMRKDMEKRILPGLVNIPAARERVRSLISDSIAVIGEEKAAELLSIPDDPAFFTEAMLYTIFNDHKIGDRRSPDLADRLLSNRPPHVTGSFIGRAGELKQCAARLDADSPLFVCGVAGIGKSEFAKAFAAKYRKHYTNILYLFYTRSLKQTITAMRFEDDPDGMDDDALFSRHYGLLCRCREDTLVILDNFDVYPEDDPFFREFSENVFHLLVTTRCHLPRRNTLLLDELDAGNDLFPLFCELCPIARRANDAHDEETIAAIRDIIEVLHRHTLTVTLAALTLSASGMEPIALLKELRTCGISPPSGESVELYKDGAYSDGLMREHLKKLLQLGNLSDPERYLMQNLALMPDNGTYKPYFKEWLGLPDLSDAQQLVRYGFFTYLEKYSANDYLPKLVARMAYVMKENNLNAPCDRAVYLNYRALLESNQGDAIHAVKHLRRAVAILEELPAKEQSERTNAALSNSYSNLAMALSRDNKHIQAFYLARGNRIKAAEYQKKPELPMTGAD